MKATYLKRNKILDSQVEVTKLREEKQNLEDLLTKLRVENEQLRRKRVSSVTMHSQAILEARRHQNMHESTQLSHEVGCFLFCRAFILFLSS